MGYTSDVLVTVTVYVCVAFPLTTLTVTVFSPALQVAAVPFPTGVEPLRIVTAAASSSGVAVIVFVALVVVAMYSVTDPSKAGVSVSAPIVSPERRALKGLPCREGRSRR